MAHGFALTYDLISLHRDLRVNPKTGLVGRGVPGYLRCLVPGAFLTAFAHGESALTAASRRFGIRQAATQAPYHLGTRGVVDAYQDAGIPLAARARVAPRGTSIWPWRLLDGTALADYLSDAVAIRNRIAHTGSADGANVKSEWFTLEDGKPSPVTLMAVEGILQAAQDITFLTLDTGGLAEWEWYLPWRTSTGKMKKYLASDDRFPLPG